MRREPPGQCLPWSPQPSLATRAEPQGRLAQNRRWGGTYRPRAAFSGSATARSEGSAVGRRGTGRRSRSRSASTSCVFASSSWGGVSSCPTFCRGTRATATFRRISSAGNPRRAATTSSTNDERLTPFVAQYACTRAKRAPLMLTARLVCFRMMGQRGYLKSGPRAQVCSTRHAEIRRAELPRRVRRPPARDVVSSPPGERRHAPRSPYRGRAS